MFGIDANEALCDWQSLVRLRRTERSGPSCERCGQLGDPIYLRPTAVCRFFFIDSGYCVLILPHKGSIP